MEIINKTLVDMRIKKFEQIASEWITKYRRDDEELMVIKQTEPEMMFKIEKSKNAALPKHR